MDIFRPIRIVVLTAFLFSLLLSCNKADDDGPSAKDQAGAPSSTTKDEVVYRSNDGRELSKAEIRAMQPRTIRDFLLLDRATPEADSLLREARQLGNANDLQACLKLISDAAALAPEWPQPFYDAAYTYLVNGDWESALFYYEKVDKLAPDGYLSTKAAAHTLKKELDSKLPEGFYRDFISIEQQRDPKQQEQEVRDLTGLVPNFGPAWRLLASLLPDPQARIAVIERGVTADCDPETLGLLRVNKAVALGQLGREEDAIQLLGDIMFDEATTGLTYAMASSTLKQAVQ